MTMKTYIYKATDSSRKRGYNRTIDVYRVKNNVPEWIGRDEEVNTASYRGDRGTAWGVVSEATGLTLDRGGYKPLTENKNQLFEV